MSLTGKRIVITRPAEQAQKFAEQLAAGGAVPVILPLITLQPPENPGLLDAALCHLDAYDWVLFTSATAVPHVIQHTTTDRWPAAHWPSVAAIGPATAHALTDQQIRVALTAERHVAEGLFEALASHTDLRGKRILLPQGDLARPVLAALLRAAGAHVDCVVAYRTVRPAVDPALLAAPFDTITFTSTSAVHNFVDSFDDPLAVIREARVACIGPVTADAAREAGLPLHAVADPHTLDGLIIALEGLFTPP